MATPAKIYVLQAYRAAVLVLTHICIILVVIFGVEIVEMAVAFAGGFSGHGGEPLIYGILRLSYLFQTIDVALVVTFGIFAVIDAVKIFTESE